MGSMDGTNDCAYICEALEKELSPPSQKLRISVTGAAGRMGSAICRLLKIEGHYVVASDWTKNEHMAEDEFCDEYHVVDLTDMDNCLEVTRGVDLVFNFATAMGGMGSSKSNPSVIMCNNTIIGNNMVEAARINGVQRSFHVSIAFVYPELKLVETEVSLKESVAWLAEECFVVVFFLSGAQALCFIDVMQLNEINFCSIGLQPQYPNGFEKLETEGLCKRYYEDFRFECRIGRFYCIYDPSGTWEGGRGKAPAAFCGEASTFTDKFEMCGDGLQTRIHKYAEDVLRLMESDSREPAYIGSLDLRELVNIGSDEIVSKNETAEMGLRFEDKKLPIHHHIPGPEGIHGRNSDDTLIEEKLGCVEVLKDWLRMTCFWIKEPIERLNAQGTDSSTEAPVELGSLQTARGKE